MKTSLSCVLLIGVLFGLTSNASASSLFGAGLKPTPNVKLFGQKLSWPIPSLCLGAKAGTVPDAKVSPEGLFFKVPYLAIDVPFPSLTLTNKVGTTVVKLGAVEVNEPKSKNRKKK
tara:strand:+ start:190 stop:537 length:348 start_codon:yes stop_codon:yes gene_type:complete